MPSSVDSGQQIQQEGHDAQSAISSERSPESTGNSPLEFAPFITPELSQFDSDPAVYDSLLSPTRFEWDMANMWMTNFAADSWALAELMELPADASME